MKRRLLSILLALLVLTGSVVFFATAEETSYSGACGENATWSYDATTKTLTISGTGPMENADVCIWFKADFAKDVTCVVIQNGITAIGMNAFSQFDNLTTVKIPTTVTRIEEQAFRFCGKITSVAFPSALEYIGKQAFSYCSDLTSIELPESLKECGPGSFENCTSLTRVTLPSGLKQIPYSMFQSCNSLKEITIPASVEKVDAWPFDNCPALSVINFKGNAPAFHECALRGVTAVVGYPGNNETWTTDKLQNYDGNITWLANNPGSLSGTFGNSNPMTWKMEGSTLYIIGDGYMDGWTSSEKPHPPWYPYRGLIKKVVLDGKIENIYTGAFWGFTELTEVIWSPTVNRIFNSAFVDCTSLCSIEIPDAITSIGGEAFRGCTALKTVKLPEKLRELSNGVFLDCTSLKSLMIPYGVRDLGSGVFSNSGIESIYFTGNIPGFSQTTYNAGTFGGVKNVTVYYAQNNETWTTERIQKEQSRYSDGSVRFVATEELNSYTVFQEFVDDSKQNGSTTTGGNGADFEDNVGSGGYTENGKDPEVPDNVGPIIDGTNASEQSATTEGTQPSMENTLEPQQTLQEDEKTKTGGTWLVIIVVIGIVVVADAVVGMIYLKKRKKNNVRK